MGESGKENGREGRMREKIEESQDPTFIGQGAGKPEEDGGRGQFEHNEFRSPRL